MVDYIVLDIVWISADPDQAVTEAMQRGELLIPRPFASGHQVCITAA